jgi:hypothetical protein
LNSSFPLGHNSPAGSSNSLPLGHNPFSLGQNPRAWVVNSLPSGHRNAALGHSNVQAQNCNSQFLKATLAAANHSPQGLRQ